MIPFSLMTNILVENITYSYQIFRIKIDKVDTRIFVALHAMVASHRQSISGKWYVKLECASSVPSPGVGGVPGRFP